MIAVISCAPILILELQLFTASRQSAAFRFQNRLRTSGTRTVKHRFGNGKVKINLVYVILMDPSHPVSQ